MQNSLSSSLPASTWAQLCRDGRRRSGTSTTACRSSPTSSTVPGGSASCRRCDALGMT